MKKLAAIMLLASGLFANAHPGLKDSLNLKIMPVFAGKNLIIGTDYVTEKGDTVKIEKFKFYLSAIAVRFEDGSFYHEDNSYHLIDMETASTLNIILKKFPGRKMEMIRFNIGVDSIASTSGALAGELDPMKGMYWAWNSGYINAKLEGVCMSRKKQHVFEFHVGGYLSPGYALREISLPLNDNGAKEITLTCDAAAWLNGLDLKKENSIVIPGPEAMRMADNYSKMFSVTSSL